MHSTQHPISYLRQLVGEVPLGNRHQSALSDGGSQHLRELEQTVSQCLLDLDILDCCQLQVQRLKVRPSLRTTHEQHTREVIGTVELNLSGLLTAHRDEHIDEGLVEVKSLERDEEPDQVLISM